MAERLSATGSIREISGRVLVKETNAGIPDLVVMVFDRDPPEIVPLTPSPPPPVIQRKAAAQSANIATPPPADLGNRLGSVLTDSRGNFSLPIFPETSAHFGVDRVPDLLVAVFAPEDVAQGGPPTSVNAEERLLCLTRARYNAGPVEAYVVRIPRATLDTFGIAVSASPQPVSPDDEAGRFAASLGRTLALRTSVASQLAPILQPVADHQTSVLADANKFVRGLSRLPAARQASSPYWVAPGADRGAIHQQAIQDGLARLKTYPAQPVLALDNVALKNLGITINQNGSFSGKVDATSFAQQALTNTDLTRVRSLLDACCPPEKQLDDLLAQSSSAAAVPPPPSPPSAQSQSPTPAEVSATVLDRVMGQIEPLAAAEAITPDGRPTIDEITAEVAKFAPKGGPSDAVAFHDFNVLQVAFKDVWEEAFDATLKDKVSELYQEATKLYADAGLTVPSFNDLQDVDDLKSFLYTITNTLGWTAPEVSLGTSDSTGTHTVTARNSLTNWTTSWLNQVPPPKPSASAHTPNSDVTTAFPQVIPVWNTLSIAQQASIIQQAAIWKDAPTQTAKDQAVAVVSIIISEPGGSGGRFAQLILGLGDALSQPYAFDVFAKNTYNFGIITTYRQQWTPLSYQTGDLISTIPLAPGESRKYSSKRIVKSSRTVKTSEKSSDATSTQRTETARAEAEIMKRATSTTNFKETAHASFNIGIANVDSTTEFSLNQEQFSSASKKDFHEATLKAAEEYRLERSMEVDSSNSEETETTVSGEISNPNNELTVTYLFYELQRRYRIEEVLHRVRPVILVAQDVPAPHEITEAWLVSYQWILERALLDESLRPALDYLGSGRAGDEVSTEILKASWLAQRDLVAKLEAQVTDQQAMRDRLRDYLVTTAYQEEIDKASELPLAVRIATMDLAPDPAKLDAETLKAKANAAKTRLQYAEQALDDAQKKLTDASAAFYQATKEYGAALQNQYSRTVAIDQLRLNVIQNIHWYMQAIWSSEPDSQRFFRLYDLEVTCPEPATNCFIVPTVPVKPTFSLDLGSLAARYTDRLRVTPKAKQSVSFQSMCVPSVANAPTRQLVEIADLDNPLGFKGNYIIFPLKESNYLTNFMLQEFIDDYFGVSDPDEGGNYSIDDLGAYVACVLDNPLVAGADKELIKQFYIERLTNDRPTSDEIVVPTGQLFIEALPGSHPLLEDYKLIARVEDLKGLMADVRRKELENLRMAARIADGDLGDPQIDKKIIVQTGASVGLNTDA